ncbi:N amino acid transport system protein [Vanrija pseudolonga]|uniref:N amino acid transport system protein n=1 Tax=Vanrija pseudolonga TaxID=143232 RepID=A0AAF1BR07_9TREE|nr:N amino acid transport system protein [Vanrija pseudolonga]
MTKTDPDCKHDGSVYITAADDVDVTYPSNKDGTADAAVDGVFGALDDSAAQSYRSVTTFGAFALITKANIGLGVLSIPFVFQVLGIVPGIIVILVLHCMFAYSAAAIGPFKANHPEVYGVAEAGFVVGGRWAKEVLYVFFYMLMVIAASGAMVSLSAALNAMSSHGACTAVFIAVVAAAGALLGAIPTLSRITWLGWAGIASLMAALLTLTISVGLQGRPADAPRPPAPWTKEFKIVGRPTFEEAMAAISTVLFAYSATPTYFNIAAEMRDPRGYNRAMLTSISLITLVYLVLGSVVYAFCGQYVSTPALGSAGPLMKKVCYGLAVPALLASLTIVTHLGAKHIFVRVLHGTHDLTHPTAKHWIVWLSTVLGTTLVAYVFASAIPNFGSIIGFFGAIVVPGVSLLPYTAMWWHDNWRHAPAAERTPRRCALLAVNIFIAVASLFFTIAGAYGAGVELVKSSATRGPWSCTDNSGRRE